MGILSKIKSVLGVGRDGHERPRDRGRTTSVDDEPETGSERAVKGVDQPTADRSAAGQATADQPIADQPNEGQPNADQPSTGQPSTDTPSADHGELPSDEPADATVGTAEATTEPIDARDEPAAEEGAPVDSIKGIGGAYAQRLADAGVHSVADLAAADAEELAATTDLGAGRVGKWIERAQARTE